MTPWMANRPLGRLAFALLSLCAAEVSAPVPGIAQPGQGPTPVEIAVVERGAVSDSIRLTGTVASTKTSYLSSQVEAAVEELFVDAGDFVQEGQPLARLRVTPTKLELERAEAELATEQAELERLENGYRPEDIEVERAEVEEAAARLALAQAEERRLENLLETKAISASEYDRAHAEFLRAKADLAREQAEYERAKNGERAEAVASQRGEVAAKKAEAAMYRDMVEQHEIRAPFSGIVGQKMTEVGQWVNKGDTLFVMASVDPLRIEAALPEIYYSRVDKTSKTTVQFDALDDLEIETNVSVMIPMAIESARVFPLLIGFRNPDLRVAPGMMARVTVWLNEKDESANSLLVPKDAIVMQPNKSEAVWVVRDGEEGLAAFSEKVKTGRKFGDQVEIKEGNLAEGDRVVVRGNEVLFPGQAVSINETTTADAS